MIVNLQKTPKDKKAALLIHGRADEVMRVIMSRLQIPITPFVRQDTFLINIAQQSGGRKGTAVEVRVSSMHGEECAIPLVHCVDICFPVSALSSSAQGCLEEARSQRWCCCICFSSIFVSVTIGCTLEHCELTWNP